MPRHGTGCYTSRSGWAGDRGIPGPAPGMGEPYRIGYTDRRPFGGRIEAGGIYGVSAMAKAGKAGKAGSQRESASAVDDHGLPWRK